MLIGFCAAYSRTWKGNCSFRSNVCLSEINVGWKSTAKKRDEIPITFWLGWLDAPTSPPYRLDAHERDHRLLVRGITMIKMTQEDYFKLEICISQSLAKQRLRGRSRKKGKKANRDWENIFKKADKTNKQTWQISFCFVSECLSGTPNEASVFNP